MHHAEISLRLLEFPPSPRQRDWLTAWRTWGCPVLTPDIDLGIRDDGELIARFGDGGITAALVGLPLDAAGEHRQLIQIDAQGMNLAPLVAALSPIPCTLDGACLWMPTAPDADPRSFLVGVGRLLHGIHLAAATELADAEALRALGYLSDLGERVAVAESRQLDRGACRTCGTRRAVRL